MPRFLPPVLILALGLLAYHNALHAAFVFDDVDFLLTDPTTHHLSLALLRPTGDPFAGRTLPILSFALNYDFNGPDPVAYHAVNLAIHLLTALTLYALTRQTLLSPRLAPRFAAHATPLALATALLFVTHPLTTEVVDYAFQRTESMMALFSLLTLYALARTRARAAPSPPSSILYPLFAVLSCLAAAASKQPAYALPVLAYLYDRTFFSPTPLRRSPWLYLAFAASWPLLLYLQLGNHDYSSIGTTVTGLPTFTPWTWLLTQSTLLTHYLRLVFVPWPLSVDYSDTPIATSILQVWPHLALLTLLLLTSVYFLIRKSHPAAFVAVACFLILAPTSSILPIPTELGAERRAYLPLALLLPLLVTTAWLVLHRLRVHLGPRFPTSSFILLPSSFCLLFTLLTIRRNADYADPITLWGRTVTTRPDDARAWTNLGDAFARAGQPRYALPAFQRAAALDPDGFKAHRNLGAVLYQLHHPDQAIPELQRALEIMDEPHARADLGRALLAADRPEEALAQFARAAQAAPTDPALLNDYGRALLRQNRLDQALTQFRAALAQDPAYTDAAINAALALSALHREAEAAATLRAALTQNPTHPRALQSLAWLLTTAKDPEVRNPAEAVTDAERSVAHSPPNDLPAALGTLAAAQAATGDYDAAITTTTRAQQLAARSDPAIIPSLNAALTRYQNHQPLRP